MPKSVLPDGRQRVVRRPSGAFEVAHRGGGRIQTGSSARELRRRSGPSEGAGSGGDMRRPKVRDRASDVADEDPVHLGNESESCAATGSKRMGTRGARSEASMPCCRCSTCAALDGRLAGGAFLRFWARTRRTCRPVVISRLTGEWQQEYDHWQRRDLSARAMSTCWADGVYLQARMEPQAECMLVILGATPEGSEAETGKRVAFSFERAVVAAFARARRAGASCWSTSRPRPQGAARDCRR